VQECAKVADADKNFSRSLLEWFCCWSFGVHLSEEKEKKKKTSGDVMIHYHVGSSLGGACDLQEIIALRHKNTKKKIVFFFPTATWAKQEFPNGFSGT